MAKPDKIDLDKIFEDISNGMSVNKACVEQQVSKKTFYEKIYDNDELKNQYARAREQRGDNCIARIEKLKEQLVNKEIDYNTARVLIDTEKWEASRFHPNAYGEKKDVKLSGDPENPVVGVMNVVGVDQRIKNLLADASPAGVSEESMG